MYTLNTLPVPKHDELLHKIYNADYFFTSSYEQLAKHFLGHFVPDPIFQLAFAEIHSAVVAQVTDAAQIPADESSFYQFICQRYLDLERLPSAVMLNYYQTAVSDLQELEKRITQYEQERKDIDDKQPVTKTEEDTYRVRILAHYIDVNRAAQKEVMDFLFYRIKEFTTFQCTGRPWVTTLLYAGIPYSFRVLSNHLRPEAMSDLSNKFGDLTIPEYRELQKFYAEEDQSAFYAKTRSYIHDRRILEKIKGMMAGNHRLALRKHMFDQAFDAYERGSKYLFSCVVALQIEGLFGDYCLELGLDETSIRSGSITAKARQVAALKNNGFRNFEYYAFRFPLIRNKIAHGHVIQTSVDDLADYLMLDLFDMCLLLTSPTLPVVKAVSHLRRWRDDPTNQKLLVIYSLFREQPIPAFYQLKDVEDDARDTIIAQPFLDYLLYLTQQEESMLNKGVRKIVLGLRKAKINERWCKEVLEKLTEPVEGFDEQQFLECLARVHHSVE